MILTILRSLAVALLLAFPLSAQDIQAPDYDAWTKAAESAEALVADGTATDTRLSTVRADMVKWRSEFTEAQSINSDQIAAAKNQIAALGDPPAEGATEDPAIAERRKTLNEGLAKLQAPGITAGEAASRADGIIRGIDKIVRERQADKLLRISPSVFNPHNWATAGSMLGWMGKWISDETRWRLMQSATYNNLRENAPLIAALVLASAVLMLRGSRWMMWVARWMTQKTALRGRGLVTGFVSLGQVALPVVGALLLTNALKLTTMLGPIMTAFFQELPLVLLVVTAAWWLGARIFPINSETPSVLGFTDDGRAEGRVHTAMMSFMLALQYLLEHWISPRAENYLGGAGRVGAEKASEIAENAEASLAVLQLPLLIVAGLALFRMGQLMRHQLAIMQSQDDAAAFRQNLLRWTATLLIVIGVVSPVLGLIGYVAAANALLWPTIVTLGVIATIAVLQAYVTDIYAVLTHSEDNKGEALAPILFGVVLGLLSLPVIALVWGARPEELTELWARFLDGFPVGGVRISPGSFLAFAVVFVIGYMITRMLQGALRSTILPKTRLDRGGQNAIVSGAGYIGIFLAAVLAISIAGINLSSLAIVAGALSVGVGFGLQTIVQNFVSGIILLVERPVSEGDWIEVGGQQGIVKSISVRSTRIETFDRSEVVIPNASLITGSVTNMTRTNKHGRVVIKVGVAYGTDTRKVITILKEIAEGHPLVMMNPGPAVQFTDLGADSLNFAIYAVLSDVNFGGSVKSEMLHQIVERFAKEGIEIPFAQRDLWLRNPETLARALAHPETEAPKAEPEPEAEPAEEPAPDKVSVPLSDNDGEEEGDRR
ncbi:DUF3772 domain-containing protein [Paenirhodobacter populi]|uniref:Mechanosensitive ion channel family protein n=1 Tax=Paenirhodobacter populi TaxID=2306993 RepID=A0A443JV91_9RHOB|nr:DUF3772 domain-containing protein [Sinirhodobacter populi]RWR24442.1 mechanosensitive ion channel family protein [Sinirhodobacter populi]